MNNISVFNFENNKVRTIVDGSDIWFVAKDVAEVLGYGNPRDAISKFCKGVVKCDTLKEGGWPASIIKESDVYRLIMRSKLPSAERFQDWVCEDVLPSIRNTGGYEIPKTYSSALRMLADKYEVIEQQAQQLKVAKPKVAFYDQVAEREALMTATQVGHELNGMSARALNKILEKLDVYNMSIKRGRVFQTWFIQKGYGKLIMTEKGFSEALFTPKGAQWVFGKLNAANAA